MKFIFSFHQLPANDVAVSSEHIKSRVYLFKAATL